MTKIIAFVNTKGGTGKTTSTICLSTALAGLLYVVVWDEDAERSATEWTEQALEAGAPLPSDVEGANDALLRRARRNTEADYAIIYTPPGHSRIVDQAIATAPFVILSPRPAV